MELSEAFYAGLSLVPSETLEKASTDTESFKQLYNLTLQNFASSRVVDAGTTKSQALNKITPKKGEEPPIKYYNDLASMISAVLGTRQRRPTIPQVVYLTGTKWPSDIQKFRIDGFGMKDYNSSDVILSYGSQQGMFGPRNVYLGVSLKKKPMATSESPTMINNSFNTFLQAPKLKKLEQQINDIRIKFYANLIKEACLPGGPLSGLTNGTSAADILRLDPMKNKRDADKIFALKVKRVKENGKVENIPLLNLKGTDEIAKGGNPRLPIKTRQDFRKFVNEKLYSSPNKVNPLFQAFLDAMSDPKVSNTIADSLLNKTLKLKLYDSLDLYEGTDFEFLLVEGVGQVSRNIQPSVVSANVSDLSSMMVAVLMLKNLPTSLVFDKVKTGTGAARVNFTLLKGKYKILDIVLRYKGNFTSMPQFLGTTTTEFKRLVKQGAKIIGR